MKEVLFSHLHVQRHRGIEKLPRVAQLLKESAFELRQSGFRFWTVNHHLHLYRSPTPATPVATPLDNFVVLAHRKLSWPHSTYCCFTAGPVMARTAIDLEQRKHLPPAGAWGGDFHSGVAGLW